jgi:hypothetical protein
MSKAPLVITAVVVEKRPVAEVAATYGVARFWLYEFLARYRLGGDTAFDPRSRRPQTSPHATDPETVDLLLRLRKELTDADHDAGADTLKWHLAQHHGRTLSRATIHRILTRLRHGAHPSSADTSTQIRCHLCPDKCRHLADWLRQLKVLKRLRHERLQPAQGQRFW